jgi:8-oxo-dGTP diphosphatase
MAHAAVAITVFCRLRGSLLLDLTASVLVRRGRPPAAGLFSLPGGKIRRGEPLLTAATREAREELGLDVAAVLLDGGVPSFAATDAVSESHHFVIAHVCGWVWEAEGGGLPALAAGDDAAAALWVRAPWRRGEGLGAGLLHPRSLALAGPVEAVLCAAQRVGDAENAQRAGGGGTLI